MRSTENTRKREGQAFALQWKNNDGTMQAAFQYLNSKSRNKWTEHAIEIATRQRRRQR